MQNNVTVIGRNDCHIVLHEMSLSLRTIDSGRYLRRCACGMSCGQGDGRCGSGGRGCLGGRHGDSDRHIPHIDEHKHLIAEVSPARRGHAPGPAHLGRTALPHPDPASGDGAEGGELNGMRIIWLCLLWWKANKLPDFQQTEQ
jgi:hypothetical protein